MGSEILRRVEDHDRRNGCSLLYLETFSFQSPQFYAAAGYACACEFAGFPNGVSKYIMRKDLAAM